MWRVVWLSLVLVSTARSAPVTALFDGRLPCVARAGVQFCEGSVEHRVPSWDDVPLDVNVTLPPPEMTGPFPLIVDLHGWAAAKDGRPAVARAQRGYVVVSYTARGFYNSCGSPAARVEDPSLPDPTACTTRGWVHLADARYEIRDTQHLAGLLVDAGLVKADRIGVTGVSYGGGQSMLLATLNDRTMLPDGTLIPWQSPLGVPLKIAAALPIVPWSDLAEALTPAGRMLDYRIVNDYGERPGVQKQSLVGLLYGSAGAGGFLAPAGVDPGADLATWIPRLSAGEPYEADDQVRAIRREISAHHSAYYIDHSTPPAPLYIYNAWTDDIFPVDEAVRYWRRVRADFPTAEIALAFADGFGHPRASLAGSFAVLSRFEKFLDAHLLDAGELPPSIEVYTQGCNDAPVLGPFTATDWDALHPGEVRFRSLKMQRFEGAGADSAVATVVDPLGGSSSCRTVPAEDDPAAATWRLPAARGDGYTLLGAPTIIAHLEVAGSYAQIAARLWDVAPDGQQTMITHSFYRPRTDNAGPQVFQLHANGWHFAAGHRPKLELLGSSSPFGRASNGEFGVTVRSLELRLPVHETPDGRVVQAPAAAVESPTTVEPDDSGPPPCGALAATGCRAATSQMLRIDDAVTWKWKGAAASFGDPEGTTAYRVCFRDHTGAVQREIVLSAGRFCGSGRRRGPCWKGESSTRVRYRDPAAPVDSVRSALFATARNRSALALQLALTPPLPSATQPLTIQLLGNRGTCWESTFTGATARAARP